MALSLGTGVSVTTIRRVAAVIAATLWSDGTAWADGTEWVDD